MRQTFNATCPACKVTGDIPREFSGKRIRCKKCGNRFSVPDFAESSTSGVIARTQPRNADEDRMNEPAQSKMEQDAERVAEEALNIFKNAWQKHKHSYPGGTIAFMYAHIDSSIAEAARRLNVSGGAVQWAHMKFTEKVQHFMKQ